MNGNASSRPPAIGTRIEFGSDRHTDKGPATGEVTNVKITVDGYYVTVRFADGQETFSWDDIREDAHVSGRRLLLVKSARADGWVKPTPAQAKSGEYFKPPMVWNGLDIAIENPAGTVREGVDETGKAWRTEFRYDYGEIVGTRGMDGDPVDVFIGPNAAAPEVYIVRQMKRKRWDEPDEDKCFLGFNSMADAKAAYLGHYDDARFYGSIIAMPVDEFVEKVRQADGQMLKAFRPILFFRRPV